MGYLHNPRQILVKIVSYNICKCYTTKNSIDPICENCAVRHNLYGLCKH
jgi:hypothetical protein